MILEKLRKQTGFTENEKIIADYMLKHSEEVQLLTSEALAKVTLTSKSSVIRLCKKLGISGYQEMKKLVYTEETLENHNHMKKLEIPTLSEKSQYSDCMKSLDGMYDNIIFKMHAQLNHNVMKRLINRLNGMERIDFYASGLGYAIGEAVAHRYGTLGFGCTAYSSINEVFLASNKNNNKTAAFVISFSGNNPSAIHNADVLKRYGIYVIGIVGIFSNEIENYCDEVIHIFEENIITGAEHVTAAFSTNYIFDLLYMNLLAKRYYKQMELHKKISYDYKK